MTAAAEPVPPELLRRLDVFRDLERDELGWLAERAELCRLDAGEALFHQGDPADFMFGLVEGAMQARRETPDGAAGPVFMARAGQLSGVLPFSRMVRFNSTGRAVTAVTFVRWPAAVVPSILQRLPGLEPKFAALLADRVREATRVEEQHERLTALGKLAAGLAHELNNPAAALQRGVEELRGLMAALPDLCAALAAQPDAAALLCRLDALRAAPGGRPDDDDPLARSDREEALAARLESLGVSDAWRQAPALLEAGFDGDRVAAELERLAAPARVAALRWLATAGGTGALVERMRDSVDRIIHLVRSVKGYSNMDRAPEEMAVDVAAGLRSTATLMGHRLRERRLRIALSLPDGLPPVRGYPAELNQVWTNLLDNAIDASPEGGRLTVEAAPAEDGVQVGIENEGGPIPPEVLARIWEPFFTTKSHGTGLGLDIVKRLVQARHGGRIDVHTDAHRTRFAVWLPTSGAALARDEPA
jgi:signal transduction histidine kinase